MIIKNEIIQPSFDSKFDNEYGTLFYNEEIRTVIVEAKAEYIPIEHFLDLFKNCSKIIEKNVVSHLIFDKRNLRTFHQPSMEWYYVEWKQDMLQYGLKSYFKILPDEPWFQKCVEAGKAQIFEDYPEIKFDDYKITYVSDLEQAINTIKSY